MPPVQPLQGQPLPTETPGANGSSTKNNTPLIVAIVAILVLAAIGAVMYFFMVSQNKMPQGLTLDKAKQYAPSVLDKIKDSSKWQNGELWMEGKHGLPESRAVFFKTKDAGFYTVTNVDKTVVEQSLQKLNQQLDTGKDPKTQSENDVALYTGNEYQIDMLGLMSQIGFAVDPSVIEYLSGLLTLFGATDKEPTYVACKADLPNYTAKANAYLAGLTPNYVFDTKFESYQWHLDTVDLKKNLSMKTLSPLCYEFLDKYLDSKVEVDGIENTKLVFEVPKESDDATTFIVHQADSKADDATYFKILKLELTSRNKAALPKTVDGNPTSLFTRKNVYALSVSACKGLPIITSGKTYIMPDATRYRGPDIRDSGYYCTESEAQADKYQKAN